MLRVRPTATFSVGGKVTGVSAGICTITVTSDNGLEASCDVTVEALDNVAVDEFKNKDVDTEAMLQLTDAEVLYVYEKTIYLRDAKGCIMLSNTALDVKTNDVVNGTIYVKVSKSNDMILAEAVEGVTATDGLTVTAGTEVKPHEVKLEELTSASYGDYVVMKDVTLVRDNGVWAVSGDTKVRLWNLFQIPDISVPKSTDDKTYNITGIFQTNVVDDVVIQEIEMLKSPEEVTSSGISTVSRSGAEADAPLYNLQGQRVNRTVKGLLIRNGRKFLNK